MWSCCRSRIVLILFLLWGLSFLLGAILSPLLFPRLIRRLISGQMVLEPTANSLTYPKWVTIPLPIKTDFYLFNVTNADAVLDGEQPVVSQAGPYTFDERRDKVEVRWDSEAGTVHYGQRRRWIHRDNESTSLDEQLTVLNVPMVAAGAEVTRKGYDFFYFVMNEFLSAVGAHLFIRHSARELLFEGYQDALLKESAELPFGPVPFDRFGWFYERNNTVSDGYFTIATGQNHSLSRLGRMVDWNSESTLDRYWKPGQCTNLADMTAGDLQPPFPGTRPDSVVLFVGDICAGLRLHFQGEVELHGLTALRYAVTRDSLNYTIESNKCFCETETSCPPDGILNITQCQHGAPAMISLPHFLHSGVSANESVSGLEPKEEEHAFFMDFEPNIWVPLRVAARMQINVLVERNHGLKFTRKLGAARTYFPVIWFSGTSEITEDMAGEVKMIQRLPMIINISSILQIFAGVFIVMSSLFVHIRIGRRSRRVSPPRGPVEVNNNEDEVRNLTVK